MKFIENEDKTKDVLFLFQKSNVTEVLKIFKIVIVNLHWRNRQIRCENSMLSSLVFDLS